MNRKDQNLTFNFEGEHGMILFTIEDEFSRATYWLNIEDYTKLLSELQEAAQYL